MVKRLDVFRKHFAGLEAQYMLIGGMACTVLLEQAQSSFRITKDLDIVLCAEALTSEFFKVFWDFIAAGGYEIRQKSDGRPRLYRFAKPADPRYPGMIELFSRKPDFSLAEDAHLAPIPSDDEAYSLSAILLDDAYYEFIRSDALTLDGLTVVDANHLIPLKIRAFLDLRERRAAGEAVDAKSVSKHKNDVLRLIAVAPNIGRLPLPTGMQQDLRQFIEIMREDRPSLRDLGIVHITLDDMLENLNMMYA